VRQPSGASYVKTLPRQNDTVVAYHDEFYRLRLAALKSVDDLVDAMFERLDSLGLLDNTYVIYTTDNGFHIGQHRLFPGKACAYEEDINVPMFIRGPGVPKGRTVNTPTSHTDIVPTLFQLAHIPLLKQFDGTPMPVTSNISVHTKSEHVNVEFWGQSLDEGAYGHATPLPNNTYKALRIVAEKYDYAYTVWCTNEHELYDMKVRLNAMPLGERRRLTSCTQVDPSQMNNLWSRNDTTQGYSLECLQPRLDSLLMVLKSCKGEVCVKPWETLHPAGDVKTLEDAMNTKYDDFYASQPKVAFEACLLGYFPAAEGPQAALPFIPDEYSYLDGSHWSDWT
jgi:N-acetylglucosamine-6-sulfatase